MFDGLLNREGSRNSGGILYRDQNGRLHNSCGQEIIDGVALSAEEKRSLLKTPGQIADWQRSRGVYTPKIFWSWDLGRVEECQECGVDLDGGGNRAYIVDGDAYVCDSCL